MEVGHKTLKGETFRNLQGFFKEQVQAYHGDYGVACIQHALTGELARLGLCAHVHAHSWNDQSCSEISQCVHFGDNGPLLSGTPSCSVVGPDWRSGI